MGGAAHVIALDIQEHFLSKARAAAELAGVEDRCEFTSETDKEADIIISLDSLNPEDILVQMHRLLNLHGRVMAAFEPTRYHPFGGHLFSVFPPAHLLFSERALIRWRSDFKHDGATCFAEVAGGLNMMTISRFEQIVKNSPLESEYIELVPIRKIALNAGRLTREWTICSRHLFFERRSLAVAA